MSQSATARARSPHARPSARRAAPAGPRRVSGPVRRVATAGGAAAAPSRRTTSAFDRIAALPDHRIVDSLLRSSAWIWVIGIALGGIVAMQVSLLKLNAGIGRAVEATTTLERQNATLETSVARLSSGQRIQDSTASSGMVMPASGSVAYVKVRPGTDARWAAARMQAPSPAAAALMANHGIVPGSLMAPAADPAAAPAPAATTTTTTTPAPVAPVAPATTAAAPAPTTTAPAPATTTAPTTAAVPVTPAGQGG
jgi:hypothetical protein